MAKLYFRYSVMNSGKSTALMQAAHNYEERGMHVLVLKPATDTKADGAVVSRLGLTRQADCVVKNNTSVRELLLKHTQGKDISAILIDEAQFLELSQVDELFWFAVDENIPVLAYGLRTDFATIGFPGASRLLELAHELHEIKTVCRCGKKAMFNARKVNGKFVSEGNQVAIDNQDHIEYETLCAQDYKKLVLEK